MVAEAWEEVLPHPLVWSWKILLNHKDSNRLKREEIKESKTDDNPVSLLEKIHGCDSINVEDVNEWMADDNARVFQDFSKDVTVERVTI